MIGFAESFTVWILATTIPAFLGLTAITWAGPKVRSRYVAAFALGIFLWFFLDTIGGSANLDVNDGFTGGVSHVGVVVLFIAGSLFFFWADRNRSTLNAESTIGRYGIAVPMLIAIAIGLHGLGEGSAFGGTASTTSSMSLLDAFGGVNAGIAYVLHKALEPIMVGACYSIYSAKGTHGASGRIMDLVVLTLLFAAPSVIGAAAGYFLVIDATYFFGLGTGAAIYAAFRIAAPIFYPIGDSSGKDSIKTAIILLLGFLAIYVAALFHS